MKNEEDAVALTSSCYASLLRFCLSPAALSHGRRLHAHLARHGRHRDPRLACALLAMYARHCRCCHSSSASLQEARMLFDGIACPNGPAWTTLILAYSYHGVHREVLRLFNRMSMEGLKPSRFALLPALSASARLLDLAQGKLVHSHIAACGPLLTSDAALHTSILTMYAKCGSVDVARRVFNQQGIADQITWNAMISAYAQNGHDEEAIGLLQGMCLVAGEKPDRATFLGLLSPCNNNSLISLAVTHMKHALIISTGFDSDLPVRTALFNLYAMCGSLTDARAVFDGMPSRDMVSWSAIIAAYARNGLFQEALELLRHMVSQGVNPDRGIFLCLLNACNRIEDGMVIRERIIAHNLESDTVVSTALLGMYAKCGYVSEAREVFDGMRRRDQASWNAMLTTYAQNRQVCEALGFLREMDIEGLKPDKDLFLLVVNACTTGSAAFADKDKILQEWAARFGFGSETSVMTALVGMYAARGELGDARTVFDGMQCRNQASWNSMIAAYAQNGHSKEALKCFWEMRSEGGMEPNAGSFLSLLSGHANIIPAMYARQVQELIFAHGFNFNTSVMTALLGMYAKCGNLSEARCIFDAMSERDVVTWNVMLSGYAQQGCAEEVLSLFREMESREAGWGVKPNKVSFLCLVRSCASLASLEDGKAIHEQICACGLGSDITLNTALIDMYSKCGSLRDAQFIFDGLHEHDMISMSAMSAAYVRSGHSLEAIELLGQMVLRGLKLDKAAYLCLFSACARVGSLENAREAHQSILAAATAGGFDAMDITVNNSLMSMYGKCGSPKEAWSVFDRMHERDEVSWLTMASAYVRNGHSLEALELFGQMLSEEGKVGGAAAKTALLGMYGKCGRLNEAQSIFDGLGGSERDAIAWSALLAAYVQNDRRQEAVDLFHQMELEEEGVMHNKITFVSALSACASPPFFEMGRVIHSQVTACGLESDVAVANALISMYGKCGYLAEAELVFDHMIEHDATSWNAMLTACVQNGHSKRALDFFERMSLHAVKPNEVTFVGLLNACAHLGYLGAGQAIHKYIRAGGLESNAIVSTALLSMYGKCGEVEAARAIFDNMYGRDGVAWNAMLAAYARNGDSEEALRLFARMGLEGGVEPDGVTFLCLLQSCAALSSLDNGRVIHKCMAASTIAHRPLGNETTNALINMYGKCGSLEDAHSIFFNCSHNTVAWTAMLVAYAKNGDGEKALGLAQQMHSHGIEPDAVTFVCALSACSHSGLREEGWQYLVSMQDDYAATPSLTHYLCINDLLGRARCFNEAHDMVKNMPVQTTSFDLQHTYIHTGLP